MLYSCTHMTKVGVKWLGLLFIFFLATCAR